MLYSLFVVFDDAKIRNFRQITTVFSKRVLKLLVVFDDAKIRNFRQITTVTKSFKDGKRCV